MILTRQNAPVELPVAMMTALCWALLRTYAFILITFILPSSLLQTVNEPHPGTSTCFSFANTTSSKEDEVIRPLLHTAGVQQHDGETKNYSGWCLLQVFVPAGDEVAGLLEALEASGQVVVLGTLMERSRVVVEVAVGPHVSLEHLLSISRNTSRSPPRLQHARHHNKHRHSVIDEGSVEGAEAGAVRGATQEGGRERRALLEGVLGWKTLLEDIGESVFASSRRHLTGHEHLAWDNYYRYSSIATFARGLAQQHRTVECLEVGRTFEGRPLLALIIATNARQMARDYHRKVLGVRRHNARDRLNARQPQTTHNNGPKEERRDESKKGKKKNTKDVGLVSSGTAGERKVVPSEIILKKTSSGKPISRKNKINKADSQRLKLEDGRLDKKRSRKNNAEKWRLRKKRMARKRRTKTNRWVEVLSEGMFPMEALGTKPQAEAGWTGPQAAAERTKPERETRRTKPRAKARKTKPVILIEAGAHAREWTSPAVATYLAQQLADAGKMFLKHVSFIIVPAMNPDGYEFSITTDRLWRKNRRPIDASCVGVDLNRNWDTVWDLGAGASDLSCSYIYRGERAFSEIETRSLADLAKTFRKSLTMFVSLHSFGEFVLYPWGYTMDRSDMSTYLRYLAKRITRLLNKNGTAHFRYGQSSRMMYLASGTSDDYMHSLGVPFAYTIELPRDDFILPPQDIIPLAEDLWNTLVCTAGHLVGSRDAQNLCKKRIVRTYGKGNKTLKGWVHKKVPLAQAEEMVRRQHTAKRD